MHGEPQMVSGHFLLYGSTLYYSSTLLWRDLKQHFT
uniref:Uncharacterized protein n=1 Tax=Anguilla anguilla TaxID=7936 RepID=A0A0E9TDU3_ANGAN